MFNVDIEESVILKREIMELQQIFNTKKQFYLIRFFFFSHKFYTDKFRIPPVQSQRNPLINSSVCPVIILVHIIVFWTKVTPRSSKSARCGSGFLKVTVVNYFISSDIRLFMLCNGMYDTLLFHLFNERTTWKESRLI